MKMTSLVKNILGVTERELLFDSSYGDTQFLHTDENGQTYFRNLQNPDQLTPIGKFSTPTLAELKDMVASLAPQKRKTKCRFSILKRIDIGQLQAQLTTEDRAMVQVASNFNCLEVGSRWTRPNSGKLVEFAHQDSTQGPAATFGPLAATLYRTHFVEFSSEDGKTQGQTLYRQINLLVDVADYFGVPENGKLTLAGDEQKITDLNMDQVADQVRIGLHSDVCIIYGRRGFRNVFQLEQPYPVIDQCLNASVNYLDHGKRSHPDKLNIIARTLLRAAYEGIYLSALIRKRRVLYLTLVGGGVFHNPLDIILEEISRAHQKWADHPASRLEKVHLCLYKDDPLVAEGLASLL